jgi:hypothetical protein
VNLSLYINSRRLRQLSRTVVPTFRVDIFSLISGICESLDCLRRILYRPSGPFSCEKPSLLGDSALASMVRLEGDR